MSQHAMARGTITRFALIVASMVLAVAGVALAAPLRSSALLRASSAVGASNVSAGSLSLGLSNGASAGTWTGSVTLVPGGSGYQRLTVTNLGSVALRYAVTATSTTDALAASLTLGIVALSAGTTSCDAATYAAGALASASASLPFGSTTGTPVIGDPAPGPQVGDRVLASSAEENLCLQVSFPFGTGVGYAGRGTTATTTFSFSAESSS